MPRWWQRRDGLLGRGYSIMCKGLKAVGSMSFREKSGLCTYKSHSRRKGLCLVVIEEMAVETCLK